ncbi:exodeoxyribonuclease V subunit gamma [Psychromonas algicola]|uniref:exodeoxyribonuclease V subunit gamma n=1 Tax=Psychromonas algicola TaxID=2555642 RepID=UPI00106733AC|nr:exodeoxyribonuclease V subunit gamma [Psychromonas sp. RZ5]TEW51807.1 exodeoxyribonuclease V subunit gamma [Psychromonas sp. RZ5]
MFRVYHSNQISLLKDLLVALMQQDPLSHAFENETILVQSPGMAQWLQLEIAQATGIAANIDFPLPASFIWQQFKHVLDDVPDKSPFNKQSMTWQIMKLLPECLEDEDFAALKDYLKDDTHLRKRFQLSGKIADIFDQYLVYRPEWIDNWESLAEHQVSLENLQPEWLEAHLWQAKLWRLLVASIKEGFQSQGKAYHRAGLYQDFLATLETKTTEQLSHLPKRIFVFGISSLPESYLQALLGLGEHCDVHFLLSNPCRYYWGDIVDPKLLAKRFAQSRPKLSVQEGEVAELSPTSWQKDEAHLAWATSDDQESEVGNPLLASMGKMGRDFLYQLYSLEQQEVDAFVDIDRDNLLHHLQADILDLRDSSSSLLNDSSQRIQISQDDDSFSLHACHSVMREVEVLHDNLLAMFEKDKTLTPKDIIVMVPNIDAYAPYVEAVFSRSNNDVVIPFSISDVSAQQENPILASFLQLLNLQQSRYTREDILALLEVPAILNRFAIKQSEFDLLQHWITESGIRWGLNNESAEQWELPALNQNNWLFGLKRMLLGYAMSDNLFDGIAPYDEVQGLQGDLLGRFIEFIDTLLTLESNLNKEVSCAEWQIFINQLIDDFYLEDEDNSILFSQIRQQMQLLNEQTAQAKFDQPLSLMVLVEYLQVHIASQSNSQRFLAGQVNFCTLMPMRSIPFKVVCLLGMNDRLYPRSLLPMGFDLMVGHRKRGDRSRRDEDRYLFLEALLSAQSNFYVSYIGKDISDNSEKMPSVLVSELLNYIQQSFYLEGEQADIESIASSDQLEKALLASLTHHYPMQSFSEQYFKGEHQTYQQNWWKALQVDKEQDELTKQIANQPLPLLQSEHIELSGLIRFLQNPCKAFFNQALNVYFEIDEIEQQNDEPFALDNLQQYMLKKQQFENGLDDQALADLYAGLKAQGKLPVGEFATLVFNKDLQIMVDLASIYGGYFIGDIEQILVDIPFEGKYLIGALDDHCENGLVRIKPGNIKGKDLLKLWVEHLSYCIVYGHHLNTTLFGQTKGHYFEEISADYAHQRLSELITLYQQGLQQALPFFVESAYQWCEAVCKLQPHVFMLDELDFETRAAGQDAALKVFNNSRGYSEADDPYINRMFENIEDHWQAFEVISLQVFMPLLCNLNDLIYEEWGGK